MQAQLSFPLLLSPSLQSSGAPRDLIKNLPPSIRARIATHILFPSALPITWPKRVIGEILLLLAKAWVRRQRPRLREYHAAPHDNVRALYDSQSVRYLHTHARTTCRGDDAWRLWLGQALATKILEVNARDLRPAQHLDLFAGSGLSYLSQAKVFHLYDAAVNTILLDASAGMLDVAVRSTIPHVEREGYAALIAPDLPEAGKLAMRRDCRRTVEVIQADPDGDGAAPRGVGPTSASLQQAGPLSADSLDVASIMFGLGAISLAKAMSLAQSLLRLLKEGGRFATIDMHQPVAQLAGRWAWPIPLELRSPWLEREGYRRITVPYVLKRLWGWHDPSLYPHLMKLAVIKANGTCYGWEEIIFEIRSGRWDFGAPVMPTYQQVLVKVRISQEEADQREQASKAILACVGQEQG
jgi:ubiquinone/menaquinone biosynthesis C-methylase UbiE